MAYGPDQILEGLGNSDYERYIRTPAAGTNEPS